jgi:hypothetical protein
MAAPDERCVGPAERRVAGMLLRARLRLAGRPAKAAVEPKTDSLTNGRDGVACPETHFDFNLHYEKLVEEQASTLATGE